MPQGIMQRWVEAELWEQNYFMPTRMGAGRSILSVPVSFPLIATVIDGKVGQAQWPSNAGEDSTTAFFRLLRPLVREHAASWFYITDPDNALSVFQWEKPIDPEYFNFWELQEFERNPAEEGGVSYLCVGFHDKAGLIVIEYGESLEITLYGSELRLRELVEALQIA